MPRFFLSSQKIIPNEILTLSGRETKHLQVLRLKKGEKVTLSNGKGDEFLAEIIKITSQESLLYIERKREFTIPKKPFFILAQSIPRFSKMELILQKGTELGIDCIYPIASQRSYISHGHLNYHRWERWKRILQEAGKQSGRSLIPELKKPLLLRDFLLKESKDLFKESLHVKLFLWEAEKSQSIRAMLTSVHKRPAAVSVLVGPEGGFSDDEALLAETAGYHCVSLGPWIMRTETASIAILSILQYEWGDINFNNNH
ncbi:MAG: RsmE family RNA methyltransferase [bacterium]